MKNRLFYGVLILGLGINLFLGSRVYLLHAATSDEDTQYQNMELFVRVMETIRSHYVDGDKVKYQDLVHAALKGMVNSLDPHSEFMEARKYTEMKKDTEGAFGGIGVVIGVRTNDVNETYLTVIEPMEGTPASRAGILSGDQIIKIEGRTTKNFTIEDAVNILRGRPGTKVTITISRPSNKKEFDADLTRAVIKVASVRDFEGGYAFPVDENGIGYVRLRQFGEQTDAELERALKKMEEKGLKGLVMDLRHNPGGLLDQAKKVTEKFLPRGTLIVSTEARNAEDRSQLKASGKTPHPEFPMVVLVNGGSASASEIVAGCLQDLKRAVVLGEQTFGKGSVQSILPLADGSALRLTTAKYYTPSHKVIHEKGITPDIEVRMTDEEARLLMIKRSHVRADLIEPADRDKVAEVSDRQYDRAVDLLKGLVLVGKDGRPVDKVSQAEKVAPEKKAPVKSKAKPKAKNPARKTPEKKAPEKKSDE